VEEAEALRLKELEDLDQKQGSEKMNISRPTFQRVLASARKKTADALLNGKAIRIEGGNFEVKSLSCKCVNGCDIIAQVNNNQKEGAQNMKIAVVTDDGKTICQHFGRALYYTVVTVENGKVVGKEQRNKAGHHMPGAEHASQATHGEKHGFDANAQTSHAGMMANIMDCQLLIAGGMGWGAQVSLKQNGIESLITDVNNIDEAIQLYIQGKLPNLTERLH
jgi:predicted Fe-Mo cluster-binding NifX family protein